MHGKKTHATQSGWVNGKNIRFWRPKLAFALLAFAYLHFFWLQDNGFYASEVVLVSSLMTFREVLVGGQEYQLPLKLHPLLERPDGRVNLTVEFCQGNGLSVTVPRANQSSARHEWHQITLTVHCFEVLNFGNVQCRRCLINRLPLVNSKAT